MAWKEDPVVSAQAILRPASGRAIDGSAAITAENVAEFAPAMDDVSSATAAFQAHGFEVGPFVGVSFAVTAPVRTFERYFGVRLRLGKDGAYEFVLRNKSVGHELAGTQLPEEIRRWVQIVAFPLPPDFGPTEFHS